MEPSGSLHFPGGPIRTTGDGRENPDGAEDPVILAKRLSSMCVGMKPLQPPPEDLSKLSFFPVKPVGEIVHLKPARLTRELSASSSFKSMQGKEPKFVPYEPYKGAVHPIVSKKSQKKLKRNASSDTLPSLKDDRSVDTPPYAESSQSELRQQLTGAKSEIKLLEAQLQFQEQVNTELKRMLVAAVGEDVEVKVQHLTEDKLHLARALVNNSESITSHQEQLEYVTGQCEVWKSKFLASRTLQLLRENFDPASGLRMGSPGRKSSTCHLPSTCSLTDIANTNQKLSEALSHRLLGYIPSHPAQNTDWQVLQNFSNAELIAIQLLQISGTDKFGQGPDEACSAVVGAAAAAGCQLFPHKSCTPTSCCGQCTGEIHQL
ncbi:golgin-45 isoform X2 [Cloeon dipterum]|uniref:golgin-45 isoform X2 n=1 Tax=Cloeon dipterum TaxID=197152 RepID=UPI00321F69BC